MWLGDSQVQGGWRAEAGIVLDAGDWQDDADPENLDLIAMYGSFLFGQHAGMTDALNLPAVVAAMDLMDIERQDRPALARRLIFLHGLVREQQRTKEGK